MNPERWQRVAAAVEAVLDADESRRDAVLQQACDASESLQADIHAMLRAHAAVAKTSWPPPPKPHSQSNVDFKVDPRFTISSCLGEGGFGVVYRAWDNQLARPVAVKQLRSENADFLVRFKREFRALAELSHPGIVTVYELFVERNKAWFTMELVEGRPITESFTSPTTSLLQSEDWATLLKSRFLLLAEAVAAAHDADFLHRDLKPSNVLVTREGRVAVLDFGLATDLRSIRDPHSMLCGTPLYMAPEQFSTRGALPESDWYAVGVMLYEAIAQRAPFSPEQGDLLAQKNLETHPPNVSAHLAQLASLSAALLHPEPSRRPNRSEILATLGAATKTTTIPPARAIAESSQFVGRTNELLALCAALKHMADGSLSIVRIHGCAGCGKTALINRFVELAQAEDPTVVVLFGRCRENETLGFRAVDTVVDALSDYLRRLPQGEAEALLPQHLRETVAIFPTLRNVPAVTWSRLRAFADPGSDERRHSAFEGLRELLGRLAHTRPVIIIIDDLQWSDADSPALFRHLLRSPHAPPLLLVVAHRSDTQNPSALNELIASMSEAAPPQELHLEPLSPNETLAMAQRLIGKDHPLLDNVVDESGGLAFLVSELCLHLRNNVPNEEQSEPSPSSVGCLLSQQLRSLTREARALVELLTIAYRPMDLTVIARAANLSGTDAVIALRLLRGHHLATVTADGNHVEIYHERIRSGILRLLPATRRASLNQSLARALAETTPFEHQGLVHHFRAAGEPQRASYHALFAADCFEKDRNYDEAARFLRIVLELNLCDNPQRAAVLRRLGDCLTSAGRGPASASAYLDAADLCETDSTPQLELTYFAAEQLIRTGHIGEGRTLLEMRISPRHFRVPQGSTALTAATALWRTRAGLYSRLVYRRKTVAEPSRLLLDASWLLAGNALMFDLATAKYFQSQHLALTLESGETPRVARALGVEMLFSSLAGTRGKVKLHDTLVKLEAASGLCTDPVFTAFIPIWRGIICWLNGDFGACLLAATEAEQRVLEHGTKLTWELATARAFALSSLVWQGRLKEHRKRSLQLIIDAKERGDAYAQVLIAALAHSSIGCLAADAPSQVDALFDGIDADFTTERWLLRDIWVLYSQVERWLYSNDNERAYATLSAAWPSLEESPWMRIQVVNILLSYLHGRVALALKPSAPERQVELERVVRKSIRTLDQEQAPWATGLARLLEITLERMTGKLSRDALVARIETAQRSLESTKMVLFTYATRRALCLLDERKTYGNLDALDSELGQSGIAAPARFTRMLAPELA